MHENITPRPEDPYGVAKYAVELDLEASRRVFGINFIVFRPHNVYGERQNIGDPYRNVIGIFMNQIMQGLPCTIFGDGTQTRAFTHVSDVAPVIARSVHHSAAYGQTVNIGADAPYSLNTLALLVQRAMGTDTGIVHLPARAEVSHAFSEHGKCAELFGYTPRVTLEEGLLRMASWARKIGHREAKPFSHIEVERCLPLSWQRLKGSAR
jgi:UDP-glucose 4-epimerase